MFLIGCIGLSAFFIVICLCLLFDDFYMARLEEGYIEYLSNNGYIICILWSDTMLYDIMSQYKYHYDIKDREKLYIRVSYRNKRLSTFDIVNECKFDKIEVVSESDIEHCRRNKIHSQDILNYSNTIYIDRDGNIIYDD